MPTVSLARNLERVERLRRRIDLEALRAGPSNLRMLRLKAILLRFEGRLLALLRGGQPVPVPVRVDAHGYATRRRPFH
jgi:hypothetical protein